MRLANRGRLLLRTPGPVPFWTCICSNVETILSWTCHVYGPFESRTSLGTSILLRDTVLEKYSLRDFILLAKTKECTFFYIPDKFQCVWMTIFFSRDGVLYKLKQSNKMNVFSFCSINSFNNKSRRKYMFNGTKSVHVPRFSENQ